MLKGVIHVAYVMILVCVVPRRQVMLWPVWATLFSRRLFLTECKLVIKLQIERFGIFFFSYMIFMSYISIYIKLDYVNGL